MNMRTPLKTARNLGSAKEGADHFWKQRVTGVANLVLGLFLVWLIASLIGADHAAVKAKLANPIIAMALLALVVSGTIANRRLWVHYTLDTGGQLLDVWVLTATELARPWPTSPEQARAWAFDPARQSWSRP